MPQSYRYPNLEFDIRKLPVQPPDPPYRYSRTNFITAGQSSYAIPPAQDPEMFEKLWNVMPVSQGILTRRWGYSEWGISQQGQVFSLASEFQSNITGNRQIALSTLNFSGNGATVLFDEYGNFSNTGIFFGQVSSVPRPVSSRGILYSIAQNSLAQKWDGIVQTKWGIASPAAVNRIFPNLVFQTAVNDSTFVNGLAWNNPPGAFGTNPATPASFVSIGLATASAGLKLTNLAGTSGISTGLTVTNLELDFTTVISGLSSSDRMTFTAYLVQAGVQQALSASIAFSNGTAAAKITIPVPNGLLSDDIKNSGFGVEIYASAPYRTGFAPQCSVYSAQMDIGIATGAIATVTGSGNVTLLFGRTYFTAFQNGSTGHVSDISLASNNSGPASSETVALTSIAGSVDPQVDTILILATADGGDETTLLLAGSIPNVAVLTNTFTDDLAEEDLLLQPQFLSTDSSGNEFGCTFNTPPPITANFPIYHGGRVFMFQGLNVYFSKNVAELTTASGTIAGKFEESWPVLNTFPLAGIGTETIIGAKSDGINLYIGTNKSIWTLSGSGPVYPLPEKAHNAAGVLSVDAWDLTFMQGAPAGMMWLTPDFRVMMSDLNSYIDVGTPIQDVLNSINQSVAASVARATCFCSGTYCLFILSVPTGSSLSNNTTLVYDLKGQAWYVWYLTDTPSYLLWNIRGDGYNQLLFGTSTPYFDGTQNRYPLYVLDPTVYVDRNNTTGLGPVEYPVIIQSSWLDLYNPVARKLLNDWEWLTDSPVVGPTAPNLSVTIFRAQTGADLANNPVLYGPATPVVGPWGTIKSYTAPLNVWTAGRYFKYLLISSDTTVNILRAFHTNINDIDHEA